MPILFPARNLFYDPMDILQSTQFHYKQATSKFNAGDKLAACRSFAVAEICETRYDEQRTR